MATANLTVNVDVQRIFWRFFRYRYGLGGRPFGSWHYRLFSESRR